jgi:hypothetical protein
MIYILLALAILMYEKKVHSKEVGDSKYFYISDGMSKDTYLQMRADGMAEDRLKRFLQMEDRFLQFEQMSVCSGISYIAVAILLSNKIKELFPKYTFSYHTIHLKQIAEPNKSINKMLAYNKC